MKTLPKFQETFIPVLETLSDMNAIHRNELKVKVRDKYYSDLPRELLELKTKSGDQLVLNRIGWALSYLKIAKMISQPMRGMFQITEKGKEVLKAGRLSLSELKSDPDSLFHEKNKKRLPSGKISAEDSSPQDLIDNGMQEIEENLKLEILEKLKTIDPYYFEQVVNKLFEKMGYGVSFTTVKSGDKGVDGIINQDELGLEKIFVQAKRFNKSNVREPEIRNFIGAMSGKTTKGIFVTTSSFDKSAIEAAVGSGSTIVLIDGVALSGLMHKFGIGVQVKNVYEVKEIDEDFFL